MKLEELKSKLEELSKQWKEMPRGSEEGQKNAEDFYTFQVFPLIKELVLATQRDKVTKSYYGLILPVGTSPEPLILSILLIKPQQVCFLYTRETKKYLDRIQNETGLTRSQIDDYEVDASNVVDIYSKIKQIFVKWGKRTDIAVDISGGKKSMVSGAAMAGSIIGADIFYIDNTCYLSVYRKPEPGSEFLSLLPNPYQVFGDIELEGAAKLFSSFDYSGSKEILGKLREQVPDPRHYEVYFLLAETYEAWDAIDLNRAHSSIQKLLRKINQYKVTDATLPLVDKLPFLENQKQALQALNAIISEAERGLGLIVLTSINELKHLIFTLYHNALRREAQEKYDIAALLLYRVLEILEQRRLAVYGIDTSDPNYECVGLQEHELLSRFNQYRQSINKKYESYAHLPRKISLLDGYVLLKALGDMLCDNIDLRKLTGQVDARDFSIFAHGFKMTSKDTYNKFKSLVDDMLSSFCDLEKLDKGELHQAHRFINPFEQ